MRESAAVRPTIRFQLARVQRSALRWWSQHVVEGLRAAVRQAERERSETTAEPAPEIDRKVVRLRPATELFPALSPRGAKDSRSAWLAWNEPTLILERTRRRARSAEAHPRRFVESVTKDVPIPFTSPVDRVLAPVRRRTRRLLAALRELGSDLSALLLTSAGRAVVLLREYRARSATALRAAIAGPNPPRSGR